MFTLYCNTKLALLLKYRMVVNRKEEAIELNIQGDEDRYTSAASPQDLYSKPLPKDMRKAQPEAPSEKVSLEPDNNYYHHLGSSQGCTRNDSTSTNPYGKLQTCDMYDHTTDATAGFIGEEYSHIDEMKNKENSENHPYMRMDSAKPKATSACIEYESFAMDVNKPAVAKLNAENQYLTPIAQDTILNTSVEGNSRKLSMGGIQKGIDSETYYNVSETSDDLKSCKAKMEIEETQKDMVYDNLVE